MAQDSNWVFVNPLQKASGSTPPRGVRIVNSRTKHSERLGERLQTNAEIAERLIESIKKLNRIDGTEAQVDDLIDIVKDILENNERLKEQVGDALKDIPPNG